MESEQISEPDIEPLVEVDLSGLPDEAVSYAFDQLPDRLAMDTEFFIEAVACGHVDYDYDAQRVRLNGSPVLHLLRSLLEEKLHEMAMEIPADREQAISEAAYERYLSEINAAFP